MKIFTYLLLFFFKPTNIHLYHKIIIFNNMKSCVEANVTQKIAKQFNATLGSCNSIKCNKFKGVKYLPFCGMIHGYECN